MTVQDVINKAFKKLGVLATGETLPADMTQDGKDTLNLMLGSWSIHNVSVLVTVEESFPLVAGDGEYTIGTGGDFNTVRPLKVINASLKDAENSFFNPLSEISEDQFLSYGDRDILIGLPTKFWYRGETPLGRFRLYSKPDKAYSLFLYTQKPFAAVAALDSQLETTIDCDPVYLEAIIYNLAVRIGPDYGVVPPLEVKEMAKELYDSIAAYSSPDMTTFVDLGLRRPRATTIYTIE
jgi:hypothetical protein